MNSEQELLAELKKGSSKAFESLYKQQFRIVASLIGRMGGSQEDIEDVFQETLYVLVKKVREPEFELTAKISTFMHAIARNLWLKRNQKNQKDINVKVRDIFEMEIAEEDGSLLNQQEKELMIGVILDGVNRLDEECRKVIKLTFFKKKSHAEVAEELGYSLSFVKVKKFRCLGYLRKIVSTSPFFSYRSI